MKRLGNFLATDKVPDTIFGIPVVSRRDSYSEKDIAFFKEHPEAGGYYDMGDENEDTSSAEEVPAQGMGEVQPGEPTGEGVPQMAAKGGEAGVDLNTYMYTATNDLDRVVIDPKNIKGTGIAYDAVKDRVQIKPEDRKEFEGWLDYIAGLDPTMKKQRLVPPDWRTNPYWTSADGYQRDYDFGAAFYEGKKYDDPLTSMVRMESDGLYHLDDRGKAPNHPTFSKHSHYYLDDNLREKYGALAGDWSKGSNGEWRYVPGEAERKVPKGTIRTKRELMKQQAAKGGDAENDLRELWNRAVKSTGNLDGMARVFAAMSGESSLNQRGATAEQISNGHLARLVVHANETDRYNGNPANSGRRTVADTTNRTSHVLSKYKWGTGPGSNWFDASKMEPRFDLINRDPVSVETAKALILNGARFLNGDLRGTDWLPADAVSYGDGPKGLMPDREEIRRDENRIGPMPKGFRIGRKKGAK